MLPINLAHKNHVVGVDMIPPKNIAFSSHSLPTPLASPPFATSASALLAVVGNTADAAYVYDGSSWTTVPVVGIGTGDSTGLCIATFNRFINLSKELLLKSLLCCNTATK